MRSPADRPVRSQILGGPAAADRDGSHRVARMAERVARTLAIALIVAAVWKAFAQRGSEAEAVRVEGELRESLPRLSRSNASAVHLPLDRIPDVVERHWLIAVRRAGTSIRWSDAGVGPATAISIARAADPAGLVTVSIASADSGTVILRDSLGLLDSIAIAPPGSRVTVPAVQGTVRVDAAGGHRATARAPSERMLRPVLVVGSAGWESKFVAAALEERGWTVHSRIRVSPTATVSHGESIPLDTANHAAVILLDSIAATSTSGLLRYVRMGGGVILAAGAGRGSALATVAPAREHQPVAGSLLRSVSASAREGLPFLALTSLREDAVALDRRGGQVVVAVRREGAGRVATVGETESWRWRMTGGADAPAAHRRFWSSIVASVAYAPGPATPPVDPEAAPYAALVDALGEPTTTSAIASTQEKPLRSWWMGGAILALLLAEWVSRRIRGER